MSTWDDIKCIYGRDSELNWFGKLFITIAAPLFILILLIEWLGTKRTHR